MECQPDTLGSLGGFVEDSGGSKNLPRSCRDFIQNRLRILSFLVPSGVGSATSQKTEKSRSEPVQEARFRVF